MSKLASERLSAVLSEFHMRSFFLSISTLLASIGLIKWTNYSRFFALRLILPTVDVQMTSPFCMTTVLGGAASSISESESYSEAASGSVLRA